jgi:micrococcal nuclease
VTMTLALVSTVLLLATGVGASQCEEGAITAPATTPGAMSTAAPRVRPAATPSAPALPTPGPTAVFARVVRVVDGDTIEVDIQGKFYTVRYIGIDTPKTVHPNRPVECFGKEASRRNRQLVEGKVVTLEKDVSETDRYGRLLRYVWVDGQMVNAVLVTEGYARTYTYPPDVKYAHLFLQLEREAREASRGLWGACPAPSAPAGQE